MVILSNIKIRLLMCIFLVSFLGRINTVLAEYPVYFADANLKAAIEAEIGISDPNATDMLTLTYLKCEDEGIIDLTGLEYATNLTTLMLNYNQISDISVLYGLTNLTTLELYRNQISDISPLSELSNLERLKICYNQISDISPLSSLTSLEYLNLSCNQISDISHLTGLINLEWLYLIGNQISDISPLSDLTGLIGLDICDNLFSDISPLSNLTSLICLDISSNRLSDISPLSVLTNLEQLVLHDNQIEDISPLSGLTKMLFLMLSANQISDISSLSELTDLEVLLLWENQVGDISSLSGLVSLEELYLDKNQISDISPLSNLIDLEQLAICKNPLGVDAYNIYIPMIQSHGTTIYFDPLQWRALTINSTAGGSVIEPGEGNFEYTNLTIVDVNAEDEQGYYFIGWSGTAVEAGKVADPTASSITVTMDADYTLVANFEEIIINYLYVDDNAPNDPGPSNPDISDPGEDGSQGHPFDTIQEAIDIAESFESKVLVYPGIYQEEIIFLGKAITVQGIATSEGIPVLENPGDFAVSFYYGEGPDSILKNFIVKDSFIAVFIAGSSPTISNVTVVDNKYGIEAYADAQPDISNSIFWNNTDDDLYQCQARYSCIERGYEGEGNISTNPLFVDPNNGNYRLLSNRGRYWPEHDVWILDDITSSCIDGGDPLDDPSMEPVPNGNLINMGAYGGTAYASMSLLPMTGEVLPQEVIEQVHGVEGGFWNETSTWFMAMLQNNSDYIITQVTIEITLSGIITDDVLWYTVELGPTGATIQPGETAILSGDVGVTNEGYNVSWEIIEIMGTLTDTDSRY